MRTNVAQAKRDAERAEQGLIGDVVLLSLHSVSLDRQQIDSCSR